MRRNCPIEQVGPTRMLRVPLQGSLFVNVAYAYRVACFFDVVLLPSARQEKHPMLLLIQIGFSGSHRKILDLVRKKALAFKDNELLAQALN